MGRLPANAQQSVSEIEIAGFDRHRPAWRQAPPAAPADRPTGLCLLALSHGNNFKLTGGIAEIKFICRR
jgi:hypothetical protein